MDTDGLLFGLFLVGCGFISGYLTKRQRDADEIETLRGIVRENQQQNIDRMAAKRQQHEGERSHDETE